MWTRRTMLGQLAIAAAMPTALFANGRNQEDADDTKKKVDALWRRVSEKLDAQKWLDAEQLLCDVIDLDEELPAAYYHRGRVRFRLSRFKESVVDFDRYVKLRPRLASRQWERGIACYYAGQFQAGADQFKLYQTYHDNDVENSVWRFLCMTPNAGVKKARATMLPIRNDRRIPMMAIYELFRGNASIWDVEEAIVSDKPDAAALAYRRFYAQLYLGLYCEAVGNERLARQYLLQAADDHEKTAGINHYMWAVADVHAKRIRNKKTTQ